MGSHEVQSDDRNNSEIDEWSITTSRPTTASMRPPTFGCMLGQQLMDGRQVHRVISRTWGVPIVRLVDNAANSASWPADAEARF